MVDRIKYGIGVSAKTSTNGPLQFGWAVDLSADEIRLGMIMDPQHSNETPEMEFTERAIKPVGWIDTTITTTHATPDIATRPMSSVKFPRWEIIEGTALSFWIMNWGAAMTTGCIINVIQGFRQAWLSD